MRALSALIVAACLIVVAGYVRDEAARTRVAGPDRLLQPTAMVTTALH
jgi:hypothetical protein